MPRCVIPELKAHLASVRKLHDRHLQAGTGGVYLPFAGQDLSSQAIRGTTDSHSVLNKHMGIDLRSANILVAEQFLHGADIGAGSEQMGGEGMA